VLLYETIANPATRRRSFFSVLFFKEPEVFVLLRNKHKTKGVAGVATKSLQKGSIKMPTASTNDIWTMGPRDLKKFLTQVHREYYSSTRQQHVFNSHMLVGQVSVGSPTVDIHIFAYSLFLHSLTTRMNKSSAMCFTEPCGLAGRTESGRASDPG
jgi:hypothetical protein